MLQVGVLEEFFIGGIVFLQTDHENPRYSNILFVFKILKRTLLLMPLLIINKV